MAKKNKYKILTEKQLKSEATKLSKDSDENVAKLGNAILNSLAKGANNITDVLSAVNVVLFVAPASAMLCVSLAVSFLLFAITVTPAAIIQTALCNQKKFLKSVMRNTTDASKFYFSAVDDIIQENISIIEESNGYILEPLSESVTNWSVVTEAPDDEEESTDYTTEVEPTEDDNTVENAPDEEPTDYTAEVEPEEDSGDTGDSDTSDSEPLDDADATEEEPTDYTTEVEPTEDDNTVENAPEDEPTEEEPTDYTDEVEPEEDSDESGDSEYAESDDTTDDIDNSDVDDNSGGTENNNVKNYNLMIDFKNLHSTLGEILDSLGEVVYPQSIQNQVLARGLSNVQKIRDQLMVYMEFNFGNDYKQNLYYYSIYIQALKLNLELLKKNSQLGKE